jgi:hypothetical protein
VPYILDEFTYFFETPYDVTDKSFNQCTLDRPSGASANGRMYIVNHFLDVDIFGIKIPDQINAPKTNSKSSILAQSNLCLQAWGRVPNFVLVSGPLLNPCPLHLYVERETDGVPVVCSLTGQIGEMLLGHRTP